MPKMEIIKEAQRVALEAAKASPNIQQDKLRPHRKIAAFLFYFTSIITFMLSSYAYDNNQITAQLKELECQRTGSILGNARNMEETRKPGSPPGT